MAERTRFTGLPGEDPRFQGGGSFVNANQVRGLQRLLGERDATIAALEARLGIEEGFSTEFGFASANLWVPRTDWDSVITQGGGSSTTLSASNGFYEVTNGFCTFEFDAVIATVTSVSSGVQVVADLPLEAHASLGGAVRIGTGICQDSSTSANNRDCFALLVSGSVTQMRFTPLAGTSGLLWGNSPSLALAAGDRIAFSGRYPIA